ncbi:hypothetical protein Tco_1465367 [Tanacetum coccineum]
MPRLNQQNPPIPRRNHQNQDLPIVIRRDLKKGPSKINTTLDTIASFLVATLIALFTFLYTRDVAKQHTDTVGVQSGCLFFAIGLVAATCMIKNKLAANDSDAPPYFLNDYDTPPLLTNSDTKEVIGSDTNCENQKNHFVGSSVYINYQKNKLAANDSDAPPHFLNDSDTPPLLTDSDTKEVIGFDTNYENLMNRCKLRLFGSNLGYQ